MDTHTQVALKAAGRFGLHSTFVCGVPRIESDTQALPLARTHTHTRTRTHAHARTRTHATSRPPRDVPRHAPPLSLLAATDCARDVRQEITVAYSTPNLLLNGYRQTLFGIPSICQVDTTHRLVLEGHNSMLFGTIDAAQHFHVIGYGLCASEDTAAHEHIASCLKAEMQAIVEQRRADQQSV